jgi:uncharacterized membrane protein
VKFDTGTDRLEIFSDAVIAIAITLLVLDIKVPNSRDGRLIHDLWQRWPSYVAYVLSFAVIGIMWVSHHSMFERIQRVDRRLLFLDLWLLLGIGFLPFPTALLAEYARQGGSNSHASAAIYSATMTFIGFAFLSIWVHLARHPYLLEERASSASLRRSINLSLVSPVVYGASIGLAFVSAEACFVVYGLAALYFACGPSSRALSRLLERSSDPSPEGDSGSPVAPPGPTEPQAAADDDPDPPDPSPVAVPDPGPAPSASSVPEDRGPAPTHQP